VIITPNYEPNIISKEILPDSSASLQASIDPFVGLSGSSITLTISGASFLSGVSYTISGAGSSCTTATTTSLTSSLTFNSCTVSQGTAYAIIGPTSTSAFSVSVPASSSFITLSYNGSNVDYASNSIAEVQQQLYFAPISASTYYINPTSQSLFTNNSSSASNYVVLSNSAYNNNTWSNTISNISMTFVFTGVPGSVSSQNGGVIGVDTNSIAFTQSGSIVNGSATVSSAQLNTSDKPFQSASSDTITFTFSNSSNASISTGTISLSSIVGSAGASYSSVTYLSTPQNFLTFTLGATQIYIPDASASYGGNLIQYSYITISMPSSTDIASISVLNNPNASCSVPSLANGLLQPTNTPGVYYIDLGALAATCTGLSSTAWQAGVPLVITVSGSNVTPSTVTADAYAVFLGHLKRIPVVVVSNGTNPSVFSY
jgi:hypothetical protein